MVCLASVHIFVTPQRTLSLRSRWQASNVGEWVDGRELVMSAARIYRVVQCCPVVLCLSRTAQLAHVRSVECHVMSVECGVCVLAWRLNAEGFTYLETS